MTNYKIINLSEKPRVTPSILQKLEHIARQRMAICQSHCNIPDIGRKTALIIISEITGNLGIDILPNVFEGNISQTGGRTKIDFYFHKDFDPGIRDNIISFMGQYSAHIRQRPRYVAYNPLFGEDIKNVLLSGVSWFN